MPSPHEPTPLYQNRRQSTIRRRVVQGSLSLLAIAAVYTISTNSGFLWASLVGVPFEGTVPPVAQVPDYEAWAKYADWDTIKEATFSQVPKNALRALPEYIPSDIDPLVYTVGYLGAYNDHTQGAGSHPGVDIRIPIGTPILSIANGVVHETKESGGFGKTIVIMHPDVPTLQDSQKNQTLYSNYTHLSSIEVSAGDLVKKGQQIGLSGKSGFVTGPHLDFSINTDEAPWYPYWPFSSSEATAAGYDFVSAVNAGFQQDRARLYAVNPVVYSQTYRHYQVQTTTPVEEPIIVDDEPAVEPTTVSILEDKTPEKEPTISSERRIELRRKARIARQERREALLRAAAPAEEEEKEPETIGTDAAPTRAASSSSRPTTYITPVVIKKIETPKEASKREESSSTTVVSIAIEHDGEFRCGITGCRRESVRLTLLDGEGKIVTQPEPFTAFLRLSLGRAEVSQERFSENDFFNGSTSITLQPVSNRTIIIEILSNTFEQTVLSEPMILDRA